MNAYLNLAISYTGYALGTRSEWPFVTIRQFEAQASHFVNQTGGDWLSLSVLVPQEQRDRWENYSGTGQGWVEESYEYLGLDDPREEAPSITPYIFRRDDDMLPYKDGVQANIYIPMWQTSPPADQRIQDVNFNVLDDASFEDMFMVISEGAAYAMTPPSTTSSTTEDTTDPAGWPRSILSQPVFDSSGIDSKLVAFITSTLPHHLLFQDTLPDGVDGVDLVFRDTCGEDFTYRVNAHAVSFLGKGDLHDPASNGLRVSTADDPLFEYTNGCDAYFDMYPTSKLRETATSDRAMSSLIALIVIFVAIGLTFFFYGRLVESKKGEESGEGPPRSKSISESFSRSNKPHNSALEKSKRGKGGAPSTTVPLALDAEGRPSKPLADLHPSATVMFADIANFTAW
jgi:hypothetical protein